MCRLYVSRWLGGREQLSVRCGYHQPILPWQDEALCRGVLSPRDNIELAIYSPCVSHSCSGRRFLCVQNRHLTISLQLYRCGRSWWNLWCVTTGGMRQKNASFSTCRITPLGKRNWLRWMSLPIITDNAIVCPEGEDGAIAVASCWTLPRHGRRIRHRLARRQRFSVRHLHRRNAQYCDTQEGTRAHMTEPARRRLVWCRRQEISAISTCSSWMSFDAWTQIVRKICFIWPDEEIYWTNSLFLNTWLLKHFWNILKKQFHLDDSYERLHNQITVEYTNSLLQKEKNHQTENRYCFSSSVRQIERLRAGEYIAFVMRNSCTPTHR